MSHDQDDFDPGFKLALPFDSDHPLFSRGVEVGMTWARLEHEPVPVTVTVRADNAEMMMRIAQAKGVEFSAEVLNHQWYRVTFGKATPGWGA